MASNLKEWNQELWGRTSEPLLDICADTVLFLAAFASHKVLDLALTAMVPTGWHKPEQSLHEVVFVSFSIIYVSLLYDIIAIFIPWLKRLPKHNHVKKE